VACSERVEREVDEVRVGDVVRVWVHADASWVTHNAWDHFACEPGCKARGVWARVTQVVDGRRIWGFEVLAPGVDPGE
jgi:hypothetical protein